MGLLDLLEKVSPGVRAVRQQIPAHRAWWDEQNGAVLDALAAGGAGPVWVALGDSTAQGVGASSPERGYVGLVLDALRAEDAGWQVLNLSVSGATVRQLLDDQLPRYEATVEQLGEPPALVTCGIGINDLLPTPLPQLAAELGELVRRLPAGAVVLDVPQGLRPRKAARANVALRDVAAGRAVTVVDLWSASGGPRRTTCAADRYHPSDEGYRRWARPLLEARPQRSC